MKNKLKKTAIWMTAGLVGILMISYLNQVVAVSRAPARYAPLGQLHEVDGHAMHIKCMGSRLPAIVFESGWAVEGSNWHGLARDLALDHMVCWYDRAGYGFSEPGPAPRRSDVIATELHALLDIAGVPRPMVMVGHSLGGLVASLYTQKYPQDIAGLVLLDPAPLDYSGSRRRSKREFGFDINHGADLFKSLGRGTDLGFTRLVLDSGLYSPLFQTILDNFDQQVVDGFLHRVATPGYWGTVEREFGELAAATTLLDQKKGFGELPLLVASAGQSAWASYFDERKARIIHKFMRSQHLQYTGFSRQSEFAVVPTVNHMMHLIDRPAVAKLVHEFITTRVSDPDRRAAVGRPENVH